MTRPVLPECHLPNCQFEECEGDRSECPQNYEKRIAQLEQRLREVTAERDALLSALTPNPNTRQEYEGEVWVSVNEKFGNGGGYEAYSPVPWDSIKAVMREVKRAALASKEPTQ